MNFISSKTKRFSLLSIALATSSSILQIEGAGEEDAPWLAVKTNVEGYHILRIETRGGVLPKKNCDFEGLLGVQYETLYVIVKDDNSRVSQSRISNR